LYTTLNCAGKLDVAGISDSGDGDELVGEGGTENTAASEGLGEGDGFSVGRDGKSGQDEGTAVSQTDRKGNAP
jgi:hypothetical protein